MSKLTNRFILLAAAVVLPACGGATTTSSPAPPDAATPATTVEAPAPPTSEQQPAIAEVALLEPSASTVVVTAPVVDPDLDLDPVPGEEPDDLVPLEPLEKQGDPAVPMPVDPFVRVPFAVEPIPVPIPVPPF